jgi:tetratricopeptide (TPR) repeat protein
MATRFVVDGTTELAPQASSPILKSDRNVADSTLLLAIDLKGATRGLATTRVETPDLADDDLVEIELDSGGHLWMSVREMRASPLVNTSLSRDGGEVRIGPALLAAPSRGLGDWVIRALRFFRIDPARELADLTKQELVQHIESAAGMDPGLYQLDDDAAAPKFVPAPTTAQFDDKPYLLLLHGTNSSAQGSFGDLWTQDDGGAIKALRERYGKGHILALQHRTLSESPVDNALQVTDAIPKSTTLHLLSHSRGGMVGELLARATVDANDPPFTPGELDNYQAATSTSAGKPLRALNDRLAERRYKVERFLRVACPARGTTLASDKLERYCNVLLNLADASLQLATGAVAGPLFALLKAVVKGLVHFEDLPGLAAMNPASALVKLLNSGACRVSSELIVLAGDTQGGTWAKRIGLLLVDAFFERDSDLVVDTISMCGGALRTIDVLQHLEKSPDIYHLNYFRRASTVAYVVRALCEPDPAKRRVGFEIVDVVQEPMSRGVIPLVPQSRSALDKPPIVFVLPGIMGTHLSVKGDRIWLEYPRLIFGAFDELKIGSNAVEPDGLLSDDYGSLIEFLSHTHEVVPFGYDWRLSAENAGKHLNAALRAKLGAIDAKQQPIRIVAHSMGGLVVRAMMMLDDSVWPELCVHPDARLLMLGTPNAGSHAITQLLLGQEALARMLAVFDLNHDDLDVTREVAAFPGVLDMLPDSSVRSYFDPAMWTELAALKSPAWPTPASADLQQSKTWRSRLAAQSLDPRRVFYIAGQADDTPEEIVLVEDQHQRKTVAFRSTAAGDGRVTWDSGIPAAVPAWYAAARHGDLASFGPAHAAYLEILQRGDTKLLRRDRPDTSRSAFARAATSAAGAVYFPEPAEITSLPTRDDLARAASGRDAAATSPSSRPAPIPIKVMWGDLRHAKYAVMVGHYIGDSLISAEQAIDYWLDGRLAERQRLGIYPGAIGTALALLGANGSRKSAVVIGLGEVGKLTPGDLTTAITRGVLQWIAEFDELRKGGRIRSDATSGISLLLIGTGQGGVDMDTALYSILRGVCTAVDRSQRAGMPSPLAELEFVELFQGRAHQLWHALRDIRDESGVKDRFALPAALDRLPGGRIALWDKPPAGWWRRLQITTSSFGDGDNAEIADLKDVKRLYFTNLTEGARSEVFALPFQPQVVDGLVARAIASTARDERLEKTLFELMLPNEIKDRAPQRESVVLLVDRHTANLPWELLCDPLDPDARNGAQLEPFAVQTGLVRQFATGNSGSGPKRSLVADNTAFVLGDPIAPPGYPQLPGARREARAVKELLEGARFDVEPLPDQAGAHDVVQRLIPGAYRIVHIAAHGALADADGESGIVLDQFRLSWPTLDAMRPMPELVFINCCYLGRTGDDAPTAQEDTAAATLVGRNRFAAGVGETFIRNGARVVIAAGWAVDDLGAEVFATTFYQQMLAGARFGNAVLNARKAAFQANRQSNTWGAYQCYGDPDFRLVHRSDTPQAGDGCASIEELIASVVESIHGGVEVSAVQKAAWRQRLDELVDPAAGSRADTDFRSGFKPEEQAPLFLAVAKAYGRLGCYALALECFGKAHDADPGVLPLRDYEQQANYCVRLVVQEMRKDGRTTEARKRAEDLIKRAIEDTENLLRIKPTRERYALLGSACKRLAMIRKGAGRVTALSNAARDYQQAVDLVSPYPLKFYHAQQAALLAIVAARRAGNPGAVARDAAQATLDLAVRLANADTDADDFWVQVADADHRVIQALISGELEAKDADAVVATYKAAIRPTGIHGAAIIDNIDFIIDILDDRPAGRNKELVGQLSSIRQQLQAVLMT